MTKSRFEAFEREWNDHRTALVVPFFNDRNNQRLRERAEATLLLTDNIEHEYAVTVDQLSFLNSRHFSITTSGYIAGLKRQLLAKNQPT
ncbi:uncharacterized protein ATC70_013239 [Mucor velutinosus]|uniref:Uncharacterized protein n=1 Tax=Mucor velutinosus TaxID=708070 RepID=A0AAN7D1Z8_9FUNG|nr:hypothetical protein ATC70_013239 [Mucor velutinosus]